MIHTAKLEITRAKIVIIGDKGVGKTSLMQSFKHEAFNDTPVEDDTVTKMHYVDGTRYLFTLIEIHDDWESRTEEIENTDAVIICYDDCTLDTLTETYVPKCKQYVPKAKIVVVKTKVDQAYERMDSMLVPGSEDVAQKVGAAKAFECSAKEMNGINFIFLEILRLLCLYPPPTPQKLTVVGAVQKKSTACQGLAAIVASSVPLFKQATINAKEIAWNPDCFPSVKEKINSYIPFLFRSKPSFDYKKLSEENKKKEEEEEKKRNGDDPKSDEHSSAGGSPKSKSD